jgi:hypothetical protein
MRYARMLFVGLVVALSLVCGAAVGSASPPSLPDSSVVAGLHLSHEYVMSQIVETVTVQHPDVAGERMIINASDFDVAVHKLFEIASASSSSGTSASTSQTNPDPNALPAGYEAKHISGGRYRALVDGKPLRDAATDTEMVFQGKEVAIAALREYAAAVAIAAAEAAALEQAQASAESGSGAGDQPQA